MNDTIRREHNSRKQLPWLNHPKARSLWVALCALFSGVLLGCCFPPIDANFLAWVAIVPLGIVLTERRLTSQAWAGVYLGGLAYHTIALHWISELEQGFALWGVWLVLAQLGAIVFCFSMWAARWVVARFTLPGCISVPLFWLGFESLRMAVAAALDPAAVAWLRLGSTQVEWPLIAQVAHVGGETALSALIALVNGWIYQSIVFALTWKMDAPQRLPKAALVAPLALIASVAYGWWCLSTYTPSTGPTVALLGREEWLFDRERYWEESDTPELMVWPELSDHHVFVTGPTEIPKQELPEDVEILSQTVTGDYSAWFRDRLALAAELANAAVLLGCERVDLSGDRPQRYNTVAYADARDGFIGFSDKQLLAPLYEKEVATASWLGVPAYQCYSPGPTTAKFALQTQNGEKRFACILCNDIASSQFVADIGGGIVDFFVHCGSEATDQTGVISTTLLRMTRLRAIETRRPIVRNCHQGACGVIDYLGRYTPADLDEDSHITMTIPLNTRPGRTASLSTASFVGATGLLIAACCFPGGMSPRRISNPTSRSSGCAGSQAGPSVSPKRRSSGFSLLELLAVVAILGTIAAIILPRVTTTGDTAKEKADAQNRAIINAAVERFYLNEGDWPELDLSDIGANPNYFPQGIPVNPVNGNAYELDATTYRVKVGGGGGK